MLGLILGSNTSTAILPPLSLPLPPFLLHSLLSPLSLPVLLLIDNLESYKCGDAMKFGTYPSGLGKALDYEMPR